MSHNPNTVKSQDDLSTTNDGKRSSDVVLSAVEKCERLQKQLDIAVKALTTYSQSNSTIVVFRDIDGWNVQTEIYDKCSEVAEKALKEIEELNK